MPDSFRTGERPDWRKAGLAKSRTGERPDWRKAGLARRWWRYSRTASGVTAGQSQKRDLSHPAVDFVGPANAFGADGMGPGQKPERVAGAVDRLLTTTRPFLIDPQTDDTLPQHHPTR
jgi:hypothetical protein